MESWANLLNCTWCISLVRLGSEYMCCASFTPSLCSKWFAVSKPSRFALTFHWEHSTERTLGFRAYIGFNLSRSPSWLTQTLQCFLPWFCRHFAWKVARQVCPSWTSIKMSIVPREGLELSRLMSCDVFIFTNSECLSCKKWRKQFVPFACLSVNAACLCTSTSLRLYFYCTNYWEDQ